MRMATKRSAADASDKLASVIADYYAERNVRRRILEFLGGRTLSEVTAVYINANDTSKSHPFVPLDPAELWRCLDECKEITRSLWDRNHLLAHLDVEYVNFDDPGESYQKFHETFELQRPVIEEILAAFRRFGIVPQHVLSGRGHHFVWQISRRSEAFRRLSRLGKVSRALQSKYDQPLPPHGETIGPQLAKAFSGIGLVLEYLGHEIMRKAAPACGLPVTLTAVETASRWGRRETVSVDLSEYGDPLHTRSIRAPYSVYYKPQQQRYLLGDEALEALPPLFLIPIGGMNDQEAALVMRDADRVKGLARAVGAEIPEQSRGTLRLIESYGGSELARVHDWFYEQEHDPPEAWPRSYDATALDVLPPSARRILQEPNDLLLKPSCMRHLVRLLLALGWHPRHVAGLLRSKFERDFGWGHEWFYYDAVSRADFYCRLFTGLLLTGLDDLSDFSCPPVGPLQSLAREGFEDLEPFKQSFKRRLKYDRLASRPFHGLLL
jgi:hypothetical protein